MEGRSIGLFRYDPFGACRPNRDRGTSSLAHIDGRCRVLIPFPNNKQKFTLEISPILQRKVTHFSECHPPDGYQTSRSHITERSDYCSDSSRSDEPEHVDISFIDQLNVFQRGWSHSHPSYSHIDELRPMTGHPRYFEAPRLRMIVLVQMEKKGSSSALV
jgi:hypothetical protein